MYFLKLKTHFVSFASIFLVCLSFLVWFACIPQLRQDYKANHPAEWENKVPNNSERSTSFAVWLHPYAILSEDFHLYQVRTKRFLQNGPLENILEPSAEKKQSLHPYYLQLFLNFIPASIGSNIIYHALFMACMLFIVYSLLYIYLFRFIRHQTTALVIVLFILFFFDKILRLSTFLYSIPLVLAMLLASGRIIRNNTISRGDLLAIILCCFALSGIDIWGFIISATITGIVLFYILIHLNKDQWNDKQKIRKASLMLLFFLLIIIWFAIPGISSHSDLKVRAGIHSVYKHPLPNYIQYLFYLYKEAVLLIFFCTASLLIFLSPLPSLFKKYSEKIWGERKQLAETLIACIYLLNVSAGIALVVFFFHGIEFLQTAHFLFFSGKLSVLLLLILTLITLSGFVEKKIFRWILVVIIGLLIFGFNKKMYQLTVKNERYLAYGIPDYYEETILYFQKEKKQDKNSILTLSHELNYLLAYHTNYNLVLPEGFPLHSSHTNHSIYARMNSISQVLSIDPDQWGKFIIEEHPITMNYEKDRLLADRKIFAYYLFHRAYTLGHKNYAQNYTAQPSLAQEMIRFMKLNKDLKASTKPDYIIVDPVFSWFDYKIPENYNLEKIIKGGKVKIYKRK